MLRWPETRAFENEPHTFEDEPTKYGKRKETEVKMNYSEKINGIRHDISDEMPVNITSSMTNKICLSYETIGIRYFKSRCGSRVNRTNTASHLKLF